MMWSRLSVAFIALYVLVGPCMAQNLDQTWADKQINVTWCQWESPRAAIIRDTLYIDGGALRVYPGMSDGSYGELVEDGNPRGVVYMLNFTRPFETGANFSGVLTNMTKAGGGFANNIAPNFQEGAMLANNYEWFTYGGLISSSAAASSPPKDWTAKYMAYRSGPSRPFEPGWVKEEFGNVNVTRYVTSGASVSVPSEDLGFYLGGLRGADFGAIDDLGGNATTPSLGMIEVNMATQQEETWRNLTVPKEIISRANGELAWIPVSDKGILIAIGGVILPSFATATKLLNATDVEESKRVSPGFMKNVAVYDIDKAVWYEQETSGSIPTQLTQGCTVVASAQDGSSHNIYWYGGYDGIRLTASDSFVDDVWALSVPSFIWTKVKSGDVKHARAGHKCVKPYPDQMVIVGGRGAPTGTTPKCLDKGIVQIFNLSSATWIDSYDPIKWSEYSVPSSIYDNIGGSGQGGATVTEPKGGFDNKSLAAVFKGKYDGSKIIKYYPFKRVQPSTPTPTAAFTPVPPPNNGTPSYLAPVLGVVLGLFFITLIILAILLFRRRKLLKNQTVTQSEAGTIENRRWIDNWLVGQPLPIQDKDSPTTTTDETPMSAYEEARQEYVPLTVPEIGEGQVYEIEDTSRPVELHAQTSENPTGLIPIQGGLRPSHSVASNASATSTVSHISNNSRPAISPVASDFSPSSPINHDQHRIVSDMSGITELDRGHLRGISETSVSTIGGAQYATPTDGLGSPGPRTPGSPFGPDSYSVVKERERSVGAEREEDGILRQDGGRPSLVSPLSPPGGNGESEDYMSARGSVTPTFGVGLAAHTPSVSSKRKSNFQEVLD